AKLATGGFCIEPTAASAAAVPYRCALSANRLASTNAHVHISGCANWIYDSTGETAASAIMVWSRGAIRRDHRPMPMMVTKKTPLVTGKAAIGVTPTARSSNAAGAHSSGYNQKCAV